jgi:hypothetical protein
MNKYIISLLIILVIVLIYFFIYPGLFIINIKDIVGYWSDQLGNIYNIKSIKGRLKSFVLLHGDNIIKGTISGTIFSGHIRLGPIVGLYNARNRSIIFKNGDIWYKQ